jgi:hypothetical protein
MVERPFYNRSQKPTKQCFYHASFREYINIEYLRGETAKLSSTMTSPIAIFS